MFIGEKKRCILLLIISYVVSWRFFLFRFVFNLKKKLRQEIRLAPIVSSSLSEADLTRSLN